MSQPDPHTRALLRAALRTHAERSGEAEDHGLRRDHWRPNQCLKRELERAVFLFQDYGLPASSVKPISGSNIDFYAFTCGHLTVRVRVEDTADPEALGTVTGQLHQLSDPDEDGSRSGGRTHPPVGVTLARLSWDPALRAWFDAPTGRRAVDALVAGVCQILRISEPA